MANSHFRSGTPFMRWTPLLALVLILIGAMMSIGGRATGYVAIEMAGVTLLALGSIVIGPFVIFPPRPFGFTPMEPLDEREMSIQRNFTARGHAAVGGLGVAVFAYMSVATERDWWMPGHGDWLTLMIFAACLFGGLPIALMHWAIRTPLEDEDKQ